MKGVLLQDSSQLLPHTSKLPFPIPQLDSSPPRSNFVMSLAKILIFSLGALLLAPTFSESKSIFVLEDLLGGTKSPEQNDPDEHHHFKEDPKELHSEKEKNSTMKKDDDDEDDKMSALLGNCHNTVLDHVTSQEECAFHSSGDHISNTAPSIAVCRWDPRYGSSGACLCPRSKAGCYSKDRKCYWYEGGKKSGLCISNAEKFYYVLHNLLLRRGKKDFAIRILYNSTPALGSLPYGPHGPSIIYPGGTRHHYRQQRYANQNYYNSNNNQHNTYPHVPQQFYKNPSGGYNA